MTTPDPTMVATQLLRDATQHRGDVGGIPAGRDAAIARIEHALRARAKARRRERMRAPLLVAAALILVSAGAFAVHRSQREAANGATAKSDTGRDLGRLGDPSGAVTALRDGHAEPVVQGERLGEGTELRTTGASEASLDFDNGTHVTVGGASRVRLVEQTARKRFALEAGSFSAKVAKLGVDERFVVTTPDAEVEVRGTAFRVSLVPGEPTCEGGTPTRLVVTEGVVVVTHAGAQVRVAAGGRWPDCNAPVAAAPSARPRAAEAPRPSHPVAPALVASHAAPQVAASSLLAEQNDLFAEAMRRKRAGDVPGAVSQLDRLLARFPGGPLAESAAAERARLLASDPQRAGGDR